DKTKLIVGRGIEDERGEYSAAIAQVMEIVAGGRGETVVAAIPACAHVVGGALAVIAKADLVVGAVVAAVAGDQLGLARAFEAGGGGHVEHAIGAVAILGRIAATLHLHVVDIFRIELGAHVGGNVGVGDGNAVDGPGDLVPATHVQLVMHHDRTGREVGNQ